MRAVILAGGLGMRLRPYTTVIPKPLVPIGDRPVLEHIIRSLARCGVEQIDFCVSHLGQLISAYLTNADLPPEVQLRFHWESEPLGTAGALAMVPDLEGTFIVMNGDVLTTLDYRKVLAAHREQDAALTVAMHRNDVHIDLGVIECEDGLVYNYIEKPTLHYQVSMGIYVYDARALRFLPDGPCQFPELVTRLLEAGERVGACESDADWYDIGTLSEYERAAADVERFPDKYGMEPLRFPPRAAQGPERRPGDGAPRREPALDHPPRLRGDALRAAVKRAFDVVTAAVALAVLSPLLVLIALLVVLDSPGPVFYRAERAGFRGRPLRMLKFRKMHREARGVALTVSGDERLSRLGAWLLRTKLDELPQLWHVLRGEMSLVGPRPESPCHVDRVRVDYEEILDVRPGLTGYTQLAFAQEAWILDPNDPQGHYLNSLLPQKVALDRLYASRFGTRRDIKILIATIVTLVLRQPVAVDRTSGALSLRRRPARSAEPESATRQETALAAGAALMPAPAVAPAATAPAEPS
jgi:lipopolysaccharide/colanic/teichoic acid biosynthesis glycosyltransferase/dTDP-glucose pyrophosphorylase